MKKLIQNLKPGEFGILHDMFSILCILDTDDKSKTHKAFILFINGCRSESGLTGQPVLLDNKSPWLNEYCHATDFKISSTPVQLEMDYDDDIH